MSYSIQAGHSWAPPKQLKPQQLDELLRAEIGWTEVASGLARILFGYFLLAVCIFLVVFVIVYSAVSTVTQATAAPRPGNTPPKEDLLLMWVIGLGLGMAGLLAIFTYIQIFVGKVRCVIHTPERCGARWFIFICMLTITIGPVLGSLNSVAVNLSVDTPEKKMQLRKELIESMRRGDDTQTTVLAEIKRTLNVTQIASMLVSLGTTIFFVLFIRSIGSCFQEKLLIVMSDLYLVFSTLLVVFSVYQVVFGGLTRGMLLLVAVLGIGGLVSIIWYIVLVIFARIVIVNRLKRVRSPLEA